MNEHAPATLSFTFDTEMWFSIFVLIPFKGAWRWQIRHPLSIERLDK